MPFSKYKFMHSYNHISIMLNLTNDEVLIIWNYRNIAYETFI